jgi:hypothetical protein
MHLMRFTALFAIFVLCACGGSGSTAPAIPVAGLPGTSAQAPNVRFVNGDLRIGAVDLSVQPPPTSTVTVSHLPYAQATDFIAFANFATVTVRPGGSGPFGAVLAVCVLPQLANGTAYSVVIADRNGVPSCMVFSDANYTVPGQYRMHYAAADAAIVNFGLGSIAYAVSTAVGGPLLMEGIVPLGAFVQTQNVPTSTRTLGNQVLSGGVAWAIARVTSPGAALVPLTELGLAGVFQPGTFVQPDPSGLLPFQTFIGVSLYAIDCTTLAIGMLPGSNLITCGPASIALIGVFDTR